WHGVLSDITDRKLADDELERRAAQQAAVARLGEHALERAPIEDLLYEAARSATTVLGADVALIGELLPDGERLRLRATHGWPQEQIGDTSVMTGTRSQAGYTLQTRGPVVVDDWSEETRFGKSRPLVEHGVRCGITVLIEGAGQPWGV